MKTIWLLLKPYRSRLGLLIVLSLFIGYLESIYVALLYPILNASLDMQSGLGGNPFFVVINALISAIPVENVLIASSIMFVITAIMVFLGRFIYINLSVRTEVKVTTDYKIKAFKKFTQSDYQFFVDNRQGDLLYKAKGAPESVSNTLDGIVKSLIEIVVGISVLALIITVSWKGTIAVALFGAGYYYFARYLGQRVAYAAGRKMKAYSQEENVILNEYISGVKQIKVAQNSSQWTKRFHDAVKSRWRFWSKNKIWVEIPPQVLELLLYSTVAVAVIVISSLYPSDFTSMIPLLGLLAFALFRLIPRLSTAGRYIMQIMNLLPDLEVVQELLEDKTYTRIKNGTREFSELQSGIEFRNASFTHKNKKDSTVSNISVNINKDRITAIVGPSGAGKSTLVNLLLRLYDVDGGAILIDGVDIREYDLFSFLSKVGFVGQETFIYNAPLKENIAFGGNYDLDEIIHTSKLANAHDFIQQLPRGYDSIVGDQGVRLSGGERQRIAIARAMIRKPQILVLDEATSALDSISERLVQKAIDQVSKNCTTVVVAHRLSTIRNADMIYVIDKGMIVESGTHNDLINGNGKYSMLYSKQETT